MFGKKEKEKELKKRVSEWWLGLKHLERLEILLDLGTKPDQYPTYDITAIEHIGIRVMWNYRNLEQKIEIMQKWEKEQKKERG